MNILVTAIGSFSAMSVIETLRRDGNYVVGCDIYPAEWHLESLRCNAFYQAPLATNRSVYIEFLLNTCQKEHIDILLPLTDLEIDVINESREKFISKNIILAIPGKDALMIVRNKYLLYDIFSDDKLVPSIPTFRYGVDEIPMDIVPCVAKPLDGRSSEGLYRCFTDEEYSKTLLNERYIIQRMIPGNVITVDYVRDALSGESFCVPREELLRTKNGAGISVRIFRDAKLDRLVSHIGEKLGINGCVNMEFIKNDNGYFLIDVNPRFSAGIAFSLTMGYDMITSHINCHTGKKIQPKISIREQIIVKSYVETTTQYF
ncbi:MAG: ATP-grasp domain-containing protein [Muribaculaceae bacterium]|nr:ATP-grasp domain-containing protein [Muribaculaceae bacterium]